MKSVLLGGLKVWLVNDGGRPLSAPGGRAKFYNAGTSTPATVYSDIDLTEDDALGPVVATDKLGYLPAIWLKTDKLYKVVVEQRIGVDPEQWEVLWEVDNVGYVDASEWGGGDDRFLFVDSISDLKQVDHSEYGHVFVTGYYAPGDWGEPSLFVWDGESRKTADDGAYVLPNDVLSTEAGRWVQMFDGDVLDVRKFGALPDMTQNSDIQGQVLHAIAYSQENSTRTRPITVGFVAPGRYDFAGDFDFSIYEFTDLTDNSTHQLDWFIGNGVTFHNTLTSSATFKLAKTTDCRTTEELVLGQYSNLSVEGGGSIVVDPAWWGSRSASITDCYVKCSSVTTNLKEFTRCVIESDRKIGGTATFSDMDFKERWLKSDFNLSNLTLTNCTYGVMDCVSANSYVDIKNSQSDCDYGDLCGLKVTGRTIRFFDGNTGRIRNGYFEDVTLYGFTNPSYELDNIEGSVSVVGAEVKMKNCDLTLKSGQEHSFQVLEMQSSKLEAVNKVTVFTSLIVENSILNVSGAFNVGLTTDLDEFYVRNSEVVADMTVRMKAANGGAVMKVYDSEVHGTITQYPVDISGTMTYRFDIRGNYIRRHGLTYTEAVSGVVKGKWIDNVSDDPTPVYIDSNAVNGSDSAHDYEYSGNKGTFLPLEMSTVKVYGNPEAHDASPVDPESYSISTAANNDTSHDFFILNSNDLFGTNHGYGIGVQINTMNVSLACFSIGTARYGIGVKFEFDRDTDYGPVSDITQNTGAVEEVSGILDVTHAGGTLDGGALRGIFFSKMIPFFNGRSPGEWGRCVVRFDVKRMDGRH